MDAPSDPEHVKHLLSDKVIGIESEGKAVIQIDGRQFTIKKQFLDDLRDHRMDEILSKSNKAILVLHSPQDRIVEIENAAQIYHFACHPKSFVTLNGANHMLTDKDDAFYAGNVVTNWAMRYIPKPDKRDLKQIGKSLLGWGTQVIQPRLEQGVME